MKTHKATVIVAPREGGHNGWFSGGRHWAAGQYDGEELTEEQINNLASRPGVVVLVGGKAVKPKDPTGTSTTTVALTSDEMDALNEYRKERAKNRSKLEAEEAQNPGIEFSGEKRNDAIRTAFDKAPGGAGMTGFAADAPLQDRDILHGEDPKAPAASVGKPVERPADAKAKK